MVAGLGDRPIRSARRARHGTPPILSRLLEGHTAPLGEYRTEVHGFRRHTVMGQPGYAKASVEFPETIETDRELSMVAARGMAR